MVPGPLMTEPPAVLPIPVPDWIPDAFRKVPPEKLTVPPRFSTATLPDAAAIRSTPFIFKVPRFEIAPASTVLEKVSVPLLVIPVSLLPAEILPPETSRVPLLVTVPTVPPDTVRVPLLFR